VDTSGVIKVVFYRPPGWWNQRRAYVVWLDDRPRGKLRSGQELAVETTPGHHVVRAKVAKTGSTAVRFDAPQGSPEIRVRVQYAGKRFLLDALWRGLTLTRWLTVVVEGAPQSRV
jgi:hypothetical protein